MKYFILLLCFIQTTLIASTDLIHTPHGAKAIALGGAYAADAQGPDAIFYNWAAKETHLENNAWALSHGQLFERPITTFSLQNPFGFSRIRLGAIYSEESDIRQTTLNDLGHPTETGDTFSHAITSTYASLSATFLSIDMGLRGTYFSEQLYTQSGTLTSLDAALLKKWEGIIPLSLGLTFKNITNAKIKWSTGHEENENQEITYALSTKIAHLKFNIDVITSPSTNILHSGFAYSLNNVTLRGGLLDGHLTAGIGLKTAGGTTFDYAYINPNKTFLDPEHYFSIGKALIIPPPKPKKPKPAPTKQTKQQTSLIANIHIHPQSDQFAHIWQTGGNTKVLSDTTSFSPLPSTIKVRIPNTKNVVFIRTHANNSGDIIYSGFAPKNVILWIDNKRIITSQSDAFFVKKKLTHSTKDRTEITIFGQ